MTLKKLKFTKKTATFTFDIAEPWSNDTDETEMTRVLALSLLIGNYNPLRKYCKNDQPIDIEHLEGFKTEFDNLISRVSDSMNTDIKGMLYHIREND